VAGEVGALSIDSAREFFQHKSMMNAMPSNPRWAPDSPPHLVVLTGAGISAESGLSTFRDSGGLWEGHDIREVCDISTWRRNIVAVHNFYNDRRANCVNASPNAAHQAVGRWQQRWPAHVLTQNVDDLLERGGCSEVIHLHGRLRAMMCVACGHEWEHGEGPWRPKVDRCPSCQSADSVKPGIVFFGEAAPEYQTLYMVLASLRRQDVLLIIGTSGFVLPVAMYASENRGTSVLNNLERSEHIPDRVFEHVFYMPATAAVPQVEDVLAKTLG
jgi:NAD-dependent deacetylase